MSKQFERDNDLIVDLGMNNGDDTDYYLRKGFRVVSVEANPSLCNHARMRLADAVSSGRLIIVNAAIWDKCGATTFYLNLTNDHWSSLDKGWAGRDDSAYEEVPVECISLDHLFRTYGVPCYMKVDVEGVDELIIAQLKEQGRLPYYLSIEDCRLGYQYLEDLASIGYQGFKLLDQSTVPDMTDQSIGYRFKQGASGPFGEDVPGKWLSLAAMEERYGLEVRDRDNNRKAPRTHWWDIHCRGRS